MRNNDIMIAEKVKSVESEIDGIVSTVFKDDENLIDYLRVASICQGFSVDNILLIYQQHPYVRRLYSMKYLQENGIGLKDECEPIQVVMPICKSVKYDLEPEKGKRLLMKNVVNVYDVNSLDYENEEPLFRKDLNYVYEIFNNLYATAEIKMRYGGRETIEQTKEKSRIIFVNVSDDLEHKVIDWLYGYFYIKLKYIIKQNELKGKFKDFTEYCNFLVSCCVTSVMQGFGYEYDRLYNIYDIYNDEVPDKNVMNDIQRLLRLFWVEFIKYENAYNMLFTKNEALILSQILIEPDKDSILKMIDEFYENTEIEEYKEELDSLKTKISIINDDTMELIYQDNKQGKLLITVDYGIEYV